MALADDECDGALSRVAVARATDVQWKAQLDCGRDIDRAVVRARGIPSGDGVWGVCRDRVRGFSRCPLEERPPACPARWTGPAGPERWTGEGAYPPRERRSRTTRRSDRADDRGAVPRHVHPIHPEIGRAS